MARRGFAERLELGFGVRPTGLGGELKLGLWDGGDRGRAALLLAPSIQAANAIIDAPVLVGMRLHDRVDVFASPGIAASRGLVDNRVAPSGLLARAGLGASVRVAGDLRVVPEVSVATGIVGEPSQWVNGGVGLAGEIPR